MVDVLGVAEAKRRFSELMSRVEYRGERFIIQRHGRTMAALVPADDLDLRRRLQPRALHMLSCLRLDVGGLLLEVLVDVLEFRLRLTVAAAAGEEAHLAPRPLALHYAVSLCSSSVASRIQPESD